MTKDYVTEKAAREILWPDERLVFIRGGWCERYDSTTGRERPLGGGRNNEDGFGSEYENFRVHHGLHYVFALAGQEKPLSLARMGAPGAREVGHVMVVQVATHTDREYGQVVVGWFRTAIAYARWQRRPYARQRELYAFTAPANLSRLLEIHDRERPEFKVPKGKPGAMGQNHFRYASDRAGRLQMNIWMFNILKTIRNYEQHVPR